MSASTSRYRRILLALCGSLLLFYVARWVFLLGKTERLRDLPNQGDFLFDIRHGVAYFQMNEPLPPLVAPLETRSGETIMANYALPPPLVLRALPISGGTGQLLGEDRREGLAFQQIQVTGDSLYYLAYPQKPIPILTASFRPPALTASRTQPPPVVPATLHRLSLTGGVSEKLASFPAMNASSIFAQGRPVCVFAERIYWVEIDRRKRPMYKSASLKFAPLHGGGQDTLLTGISPNTSLRVSEESQPVLWIYLPVKDSLTQKDVYRLTAADQKPRRFLSDVEPSSGIFQSVFCNGRLYWKRDAAAFSQDAYPQHRTEIVSASTDGSDLRVVYTLEEADALLGLYAHADKLYLQLEKEDSRLLMLLAPDSPTPLHEVFRFPRRSQQPYFDGDYLYYAVNEEREEVWNWSQRRRRPVRATVLYRFRLPR